ncbi:hypothetical protein D3C81_2084750 [compost metagenome]
MATLEVLQHPIEQAHALEGRQVIGQGEFVRRAAGQIGPGLGRHALAGEGLVVGDRGDFGGYLLKLRKGRHVRPLRCSTSAAAGCDRGR